VTSNTAIVCSGICLILFGLAECGERRTADPRKTLADHGFSAVEFHGHAPDSCWLGTGAHRFTATSGSERVSGVVCCFESAREADPCAVRFGIGAAAER
jgi:hypothetical protein